jgi:ABC-type sugar transport system ATPase subunit
VIAAALRAVSKRFGETLALDRVDLAVEAGEVVAVLGPNGEVQIRLRQVLGRATGGRLTP